MTGDAANGNETRRMLLVAGAIAIAVGLIVGLVLRTERESGFSPQQSDEPVTDLLGWIPASDAALRRFAAWSAETGDPLSLTAALDHLGIDAPPLAIGRSAEWQSATGISAAAVTGWAAAPDAGVTVLEGAFDQGEIISALDGHGYDRQSHRGITIWSAPPDSLGDRIVAGDDLRAMAAIALFGDRVIVGFGVDSVESALDAATGATNSLADQSAVQRAVTEWTAGIVLVDQRDIAISCGLGRDWQRSNFVAPSGARVMITWSRGSIPMTSVWVEYLDDLTALAGLTELEPQWHEGYLNQMGVGAAMANIATTQAVYVDGAFVVADLVQGRDNGWTRSGVQYLIGICEHASRQIPVTSPVRGTPVASPSPMEQP